MLFSLLRCFFTPPCLFCHYLFTLPLDIVYADAADAIASYVYAYYYTRRHAADITLRLRCRHIAFATRADAYYRCRRFAVFFHCIQLSPISSFCWRATMPSFSAIAAISMISLLAADAAAITPFHRRADAAADAIDTLLLAAAILLPSLLSMIFSDTLPLLFRLADAFRYFAAIYAVEMIVTFAFFFAFR